jgi:lysyl endopeptidase
MSPSRRWVVPILFAASVLAGCGGGGDAPPSAATPSALSPKIEPYARGTDTEPPALKTHRMPARAKASSVRLGESDPAAKSLGAPQARRQIGVARAVAQTQEASDTAALLVWQDSPRGGRMAAISFQSPGAAGVRIGLRVGQLPGTAVIRAYAQGAEPAWELPGRHVLAAIDRNVRSGDRSSAARTYWLPTVKGEEATLEIELPAGMPEGAIDVSVPQVSHLYETALEARSLLPKALSESCEVDVSCSSDYSEESKSVALMEFVSNGSTFLCTGTLLADRAATGTPYFLSANHCISTQAEASSLDTYWFIRSASCNSQELHPAATARVGGATLLYASAATDTSFMQLLEMPPAGAVYAGIANLAPAAGMPVVGLHHPQGDLQKISRGSVLSIASCSSPTSCTPNQSSGNFFQVRWTSGTTEGGSSGSAAFATSDGRRYVIGQLMSGAASCSNPSGSDYYGRFDVPYQAALKNWLDVFPTGVARTPVYRFYNETARAHFYTTSLAERDYVIASNAQYRYEGVVFYAYGAPASGMEAVFRFYNAETQSHFYTISQAERDWVRATLPKFQYEGERWWATTAQWGSSLPIHRFYSPGVGNHFYTISEAEKEYVRLYDRNWVYEGIGYYGWTQ